MKTPADLFRDMAERIEKNAPAEFAGALLVVPPDGVEPIEILLVNPKRDLAFFWASVGGAVTTAAREFEERARSVDPFRR